MTSFSEVPAGEVDPGRGRLMRALAAGQVRRGVVTEVMEYGARVDLGGVTGLLLIVDVRWGRMGPPSDHYAVGDEIDVRDAETWPRAPRRGLFRRRLTTLGLSAQRVRLRTSAAAHGQV